MERCRYTVMLKQTFLEARARKFMPKVFFGVSDVQVRRIQDYIKLYTKHPFSGTATGAILDEAASSQGKMIRPRLVMMSGAYGIQDDDVRERLYKLAAVVEMTHLASLIHDDVVDDAPFRRGKPSIQSKYGKNAAVYAGDFLMSRITYHLMREGCNRSGMVLSQAVEEMCAGEIGQTMCRYKRDVTIDEYMRNIHGKTVALFKACCRIGAMESECDERVVSVLESIGECLGYMFQMRDDLLDFAPDSSLIGKNAHQDFREGIYTIPVLIALSQPGGRQALTPYMERSAAGTLTAEDICHMEELVESLGGMEGAWEKIHAYQHKAERLISSLPGCDTSVQLCKLIRKLGAV